MPWEGVLRIVDSSLPQGARASTQARLIFAAKTFVREGLLPDIVPCRAAPSVRVDRRPAIVAAIRGADPDATLQAICDRLEAMRDRTPRGRATWHPLSVRMLLDRAARTGLLNWAPDSTTSTP